MDISKINESNASDTGADLELTHPSTGDVLVQDDDNRTPITIRILGMDSKVYRNHQQNVQRERMNKMMRARSRKNVDFVMSFEERCSLLAECTVGWSGIVDNGAEVEFSKKAAYELYHKAPWVADQVDEFMGDRANFFMMS